MYQALVQSPVQERERERKRERKREREREIGEWERRATFQGEALPHAGVNAGIGIDKQH
jgi:hypothetical protein